MPALSGQSLLRIDRSRLDHLFVGTHGLEATPHWYETGNFIEGVDFVVKELVEVSKRDGRLTERVAYAVDGNAEYAQNEGGDYQFLHEKLVGVRHFAFVVGNKIILFSAEKKGTKWHDYRISCQADSPMSYAQGRASAKIKFSGLIFRYDIIEFEEDSLRLVNNKLIYKVETRRVFQLPSQDLSVPVKTTVKTV